MNFCWMGIHNWSQWGEVVQDKGYASGVKPSEVENHLPIIITEYQVRACKYCRIMEKRVVKKSHGY